MLTPMIFYRRDSHQTHMFIVPSSKPQIIFHNYNSLRNATTPAPQAITKEKNTRKKKKNPVETLGYANLPAPSVQVHTHRYYAEIIFDNRPRNVVSSRFALAGRAFVLPKSGNDTQRGEKNRRSAERTIGIFTRRDSRNEFGFLREEFDLFAYSH